MNKERELKLLLAEIAGLFDAIITIEKEGGITLDNGRLPKWLVNDCVRFDARIRQSIGINSNVTA